MWIDASRSVGLQSWMIFGIVLMVVLSKLPAIFFINFIWSIFAGKAHQSLSFLLRSIRKLSTTYKFQLECAFEWCSRPKSQVCEGELLISFGFVCSGYLHN